MNLSPDWVGYLHSFGHDAVHRSSVGPADASDDDLVSWARTHDRAVLTSDLDFGTMLAMSGERRPSVVELRSASTLPDRIGPLVAQAISHAEADLLSGAILTVETGRLRLRILDLDRKE